MDNKPEAWLIALAATVSDGGEIDWQNAQERSETSEQREIVRQLRGVAAIVQAQRLAPNDAPPGESPDSSAALVSDWRHLILFEVIGTGAFAAVRRAWDPVLDREVAVKLLSARPGGTPLDEARHLARVRHPNVITVYGADEDSGRAGIWMEYIEGRTLAQLMREHGPMSGREAIGIGLDLCGALSAIHSAGLIHQDIKAQNVMRQVGGRIVLMDLGIAHALRQDGGATGLSGTPLYMAPELFEGTPPGIVSDLYSLGVLLFFLLTGRLPVEGNTVEDVKRAHAAGERQRLRDVRPDLPEPLVRVIERATAVDPVHRFHTAGELEQALATVSGEHGASTARAVMTPRSLARRLGIWFAAGLGILALAVTGASTRWTNVPAAPIARFTIGPPYVTGSWPRVSPDGRYVVFGATVEGRNRFWVHPIDKLAGRPLMETTATETPFWSPDSRTLCFFVADKLKRISIDGGEPYLLADAPAPHGGDWAGDSILFSRDDGIYRIAASGGAPEQVTALDKAQGDFQHAWPRFLPDGRRFLFLIRSSQADRAGLYVGSLQDRTYARLGEAYSRTTYANGYLLYVRDGSLVAQPFDSKSASIRGEPLTLAQRVNHHVRSDAAFDVSTSGVLIFSVAPAQRSTRLVLHDRRGRELYPLTPVGVFGRPRFSPDGQRVVVEQFDKDDNNTDLWVYGVTSRSATRLTRHPAHDMSPVWSPDGRRIAFSSRRGSVYDIFVKPVDGVEEERPLFSGPGDKFAEHWSPDGRYLVGTMLRSGLWMMPAATGESPRQVRAATRATTWQSEFSPDGRWLAYMSTESGKAEVYVEPFPATGSRWQVSTNGGGEPHWSQDELLYLNADRVLTRVRPEGSSWGSLRSQQIVRLPVPDITTGANYSISADGRFMVVNTFVADPLIPPIEVVVNWTKLIDRR